MALMRIGTIMVTALFLAGCGSNPDLGDPAPTPSLGTSEIAEPAPGLPDGVQGNQVGSPGAGLSDDGKLWIATYGSSSNPLVVADVAADGQTVTVTFEQPSGPATMDLVPSTSTITLPAGVDPDQPISVVLGDAGAVSLDPPEPGSIIWLPAR